MAVFQIAYNRKSTLTRLDGITSGTYVLGISPIAGQVFQTRQTVGIGNRLQLHIDGVCRIVIIDVEVGYLVLFCHISQKIVIHQTTNHHQTDDDGKQVIFGLYCLHNSSIMQKSLQNYEIFMNYA